MPYYWPFCIYITFLRDSALLPEYLQAACAHRCRQKQILLSYILLTPAFLSQYNLLQEMNPAVYPPVNSLLCKLPLADNLVHHCHYSCTAELLLSAHSQENHNVHVLFAVKSEKDFSAQDLLPAVHICHISRCSFFHVSVSHLSLCVLVHFISSYLLPLFHFAIR